MAFGLVFIVALIGLSIGYHYIDPAPPRHLVISTGSDEGDYQSYAQAYKDIIEQDGVKLELRSSSGAAENLTRLDDSNSDVDAGFVQDGIGSSDDTNTDLTSLGSLYYEPVWILYKAQHEWTRLAQLTGKRIAIGENGGGTALLAKRILQVNGVTDKNAEFVLKGWKMAIDALRTGEVDVAFVIATPEDPVIHEVLHDPKIRLMNLDQAEGITRQLRYLHHLVLPHGTIDLEKNIPQQDVHLVSATATLLVRDKIHPALVYLLMKAATQVHGQPGIFESKKEFPIDKDYSFPLHAEAERFYKSGGRFWQRYLPFWLATLVDRFIFVILPLSVVLLPLFRLVPRFLDWRVRNRIYKRYGELKFLETKIRNHPDKNLTLEYNSRLDEIEDSVNHMNVPINFTEHIYGLREHIHFVRERL